MADQRISELTELTTPAGEDLLVIVDDPTGTPVTKKIKIENLPFGSGGKYQFIIPGTISTGTNVAGTWFAPEDINIDSVSVYVNTAGATGATTIDVNKNGTTIFTTQGNRPSLSDTATVDTGNVPDVTSVAASDKITIDIDAVTTTAPVDMYVLIKYSE